MSHDDCHCLSQGLEAVDALLTGLYGIEVEKASSPLNRGAFLLLAREISDELHTLVQVPETQATRKALESLDKDWASMTGTERNSVIDQAKGVLKAAHQASLPKLDMTFSRFSNKIIEGTRRGARAEYKLKIEAKTNETDARIARFCAKSQGHFVRNELGQREETFSEKARDIVAAGLEQGLGRDDIAQDLAKGLATLGRGDGYWPMIATVFANRSRTFQQMSSFDEAGIEQFRFQSILDEVTSNQCRFLHGRRFPVQRAVDSFFSAERASDPERLVELNPFVQSGKDEEGKPILYYKKGGERISIAEIVTSAVGQKDKRGEFKDHVDDADLAKAGVMMPPLHGLCRSTVVPDI